jgi:dynactin complex subunit
MKISKTDSEKVVVDKEEFKHIINVNIEKTMQDSVVSILKNVVDVQERMLADKDSIVSLQKTDMEFLKKQIKDNTTPWWNRWIPGWVSGIITTLIAVLLIAH